jgi:hypothetical protein
VIHRKNNCLEEKEVEEEEEEEEEKILPETEEYLVWFEMKC